MKHLFLTTSVLATCLASATQAGVIEERKAKFKENVAILRAIQAQIGDGDFKAIAAGGRNIADWAIKMPEFFPEGSESTGLSTLYGLILIISSQRQLQTMRLPCN